MLKNFIFLILKSIRHRPIRSWLTVLGVIIGVMVVVTIMSLGTGIQNVISKQLNQFGNDLIIIFPGKLTESMAGFIGGMRFRDADLLNLKKIPGITTIALADIATFTVEFQGEKKSNTTHGMTWAGTKEIFEQSQGFKLAAGDFPRDDNVPEAVVGDYVANEMFKKKMGVGDEVIIKSKRFKIIGILGKTGNKEDDSSVFMSLNNQRMLTGNYAGVMMAMVRVDPRYDKEIIAEEIKFELSKQSVVEDFTVITPAKIARLAGDLLSVVELFLITLALVSLAVGAVGIMNTMYTAILERTKHIGIMKAIGASSLSILLLFLIEAGVIGIIGGLMGIAFGILLSFLLSLGFASLGVQGMFSFASLDYLGFATVLIVTFITGIVSGILPARQAAKMEPAEALRYE
jgi:putative ABC transport system permease protein